MKIPPVRLMLRLPLDIHATLVKQAAENERSLNGQIVFLLRKAIERSEKTIDD